MNARLRKFLGASVGRTPVRIRHGIAKGALWTLFPWTSYWRGTHEPAIQYAIGRLGNGDISGWSCLDLGAHFGFYSVALALRVGPTGQVAAFEPNPESFKKLDLHRRMNRLTWLNAYRSAASDRTGSSELLTYGDLGSTTTHLLYEGETKNAATKPISVDTLRLDDLFESSELRAPQFVKIDVEGHGHRSIEGMRVSVAKSRPTMLVAFHSSQEVEGVLRILEPLGYRRTTIVEPASNPEAMIGGDYLFTP
jgi:FkbM family methyltransferase